MAFKDLYFLKFFLLFSSVVMDTGGAIAFPSLSDVSRQNAENRITVLINQSLLGDKFPSELFGFKIGEKYKLGALADGDFGDLPIKKITGIALYGGRALHLYFQPNREYEHFPYIEHKEKLEKQYFSTSFHSSFLPIIPQDIKSLSELNSRWFSFEFRLMNVNWSNQKKNRSDAYYWAVDLCKTFKSYLGFDGENFDSYEYEWRSCKFRSGENVLEISNINSLSVFSLSVESDQARKLAQETDDIIRRLQAQKLLD
jgi:hypothetical protein